MGQRKYFNAGSVAIDSGMLVIGDPVSLVEEMNWEMFEDAVKNGKASEDSETPLAIRPGEDVGPIVIKPGLGDGLYPVTLVIEDGVIQDLIITFRN